jgi:hypothetical protein
VTPPSQRRPKQCEDSANTAEPTVFGFRRPVLGRSHLERYDLIQKTSWKAWQYKYCDNHSNLMTSSTLRAIRPILPSDRSKSLISGASRAVLVQARLSFHYMQGILCYLAGFVGTTSNRERRPHTKFNSGDDIRGRSWSTSLGLQMCHTTDLVCTFTHYLISPGAWPLFVSQL